MYFYVIHVDFIQPFCRFQLNIQQTACCFALHVLGWFSVDFHHKCQRSGWLLFKLPNCQTGGIHNTGFHAQSSWSLSHFRMISFIISQPCYCVCLFSLQILPQIIALDFRITQILQPEGTPPFLRNLLALPCSSSRWTWAGGPLELHSMIGKNITHKMAFVGNSMHLF